MFSPKGFSLDIFKSRYAFTEEESWEEASRRVARQMALCEQPEKIKTYEDNFFNILVNNLFVPGGRIWYNSGRNNPQLLNCFGGDTRFVTSQGVLSLRECVGKQVKIRNLKGEWEDAEVRSFGSQEIVALSLANGDEIRTTAGHEWIQKDGSRKSTMDIKEVLLNTSIPIEPDVEGIRHGIVYGDGHLQSSTQFSQVVLCGEKKQELRHFFDNTPQESIGYNGAVRRYHPVTLQSTGHVVNRQPAHYKNLPQNCSPEYARGFIAGLLATDGCVPTRGSVIISCEGYERAREISELAVLGGCVVTSVKVTSRVSPFDGSPRELSTILIKPFSAPVVREDQRSRLRKRKLKTNFRMEVQVKSVKLTGKYEEVFCVVAPKTHSFTLANGVVTGNCFVLSSELDSKEGWGNISKEMIITSMTGGGCGIDFSDVRPKGAAISGHRGECPGPVALMELIDGNSKPVKAGGHRRVALMFSMDLDHPDVLEFLDAKLTKGKLTHANVSVRSKHTSDFIRAVKANGDWELSWKGKYKKVVKAKELWDKIVKNAYESAEPGFLNWELAENESNISYIENLVTTNPCGEIALSAYDCCCLGHLVLPRFVRGDVVDWVSLGNTVRLGVRFLDNVLSVNAYPLAEMKDKSHKLRRIGLGTTGLADMLALLQLRYGGEEGNKFVDRLFRFVSKQAYEASIMLAVEKGMFPACNPRKHLESGFMKRMTPKIRSLIDEHGIRNCALLTQAPTGTVSIVSGNCSSGIEPMFAPAYERHYWEGASRKQELVFHPLFAEFMAEKKDVSHFVASRDLSVREHMEVQKLIQKHVDNAVSKTINVPQNYSVEDMSKNWLEYLPSLKGTTFYRENTRGYVAEDGTVQAPPLVALPLDEAIKRYETEKGTLRSEVDCVSGVCEI